ncbi:MAG: C1 family peptidase [Negativicutes bacterium]|nr:C1 family peptidase [Negativicutes bacterium]MDR3593081.1 C1 family peptidase [Negativicutes bacterium]
MKRKYLCKPTPIRLTDPIFHSCCFERAAHLPAKVDLRSGCSPVVDQGELGSCTANAIASGLREFLLLKEGQPLTSLSRLFLYYKERELEGTTGEDSGAMIGDGMRILKEVGVCPEADWPYDISTFANPPTARDIADAAAFKIDSYHRIPSLIMLKAALAEGLIVPTGITVYQSFASEKVAGTGRIPMPKRREEILGGHAVDTVGYDCTGKKTKYLLRNSWGKGWGQDGYFEMDEAVFKKLVTDMWTGK